MLVVKYGVILSAENIAGTSMDVAAFSDVYGGTTTVTVSDGDYVLDVQLDPVTFQTTGSLWQVIDGSPWEQASDIFPRGYLGVSTGENLPYQAGSIIVFIEQNVFVAANQSQTLAIVESAINP